jgi:hypothetical protein
MTNKGDKCRPAIGAGFVDPQKSANSMGFILCCRRQGEGRGDLLAGLLPPGWTPDGMRT